jgi:hypothetical protein
MSLLRSIDIYCERTDASLWSEPANALTNASFFVAAWLLAGELARLRQAGAAVALPLRALPPLLALIGLCSLVFHTLATLWAGLADQLSILLFGCAFLFAFLRHVAGSPAYVALAGALAFTLASYYAPQALPAGFLNQSGAYFPYLAGLVAIAAWLRAKRRAAFPAFAQAIALFCVSLALRTVDPLLCERFPLGTHWAWHLLNGAVLFVLARALVREAASKVDGPGHAG